MGLFSSSSNRKTTTNNTQIDAGDKRSVDNNSGYVGGNNQITTQGDVEGLTIEQTDFGAISGALALAENATESTVNFGRDTIEQVTDFGNNILQRQSVSQQKGLETIEKFAADIASGGQSRITDSIRNVALVAVVVGGVVMVARVFKK